MASSTFGRGCRWQLCWITVALVVIIAAVQNGCNTFLLSPKSCSQSLAYVAATAVPVLNLIVFVLFIFLILQLNMSHKGAHEAHECVHVWGCALISDACIAAAWHLALTSSIAI